MAPYLSTQVIYRSDKYLIGGILRGIDPAMEEGVTNISKFIKRGEFAGLESGIILGSELAKELEVDVGDPLWVISGTMGGSRETRVVGIVEYGVYAFDSSNCQEKNTISCFLVYAASIFFSL